MANRKGRVCILSDGEAHDLRMFGKMPDCKLHKHCSPDDAFDMTAPTWMHWRGTADGVVAEFVGPRHIRINRHFRWSVVDRSSVPLECGGSSMLSLTTNQLVPCSV